MCLRPKAYYLHKLPRWSVRLGLPCPPVRQPPPRPQPFLFFARPRLHVCEGKQGLVSSTSDLRPSWNLLRRLPTRKNQSVCIPLLLPPFLALALSSELELEPHTLAVTVATRLCCRLRWMIFFVTVIRPVTRRSGRRTVNVFLTGCCFTERLSCPAEASAAGPHLRGAPAAHAYTILHHLFLKCSSVHKQTVKLVFNANLHCRIHGGLLSTVPLRLDEIKFNESEISWSTAMAFLRCTDVD